MIQQRARKPRPVSENEKIRRTPAFKKFKEQNLENLKAEIEAEAALGDDYGPNFDPEERVLLRAFEKTPEGKEVERRLRLSLEKALTWRWFCWEIILRSDIFLKWCRRKRILPWPFFDLYYCPPRSLRNFPGLETFGKFLATKSGRRATDRLQVHKHLWPHLYKNQGIRGLGVKNLMPPSNYRRPVTLNSYSTIPLSELTPYEKAIKAWDFHHFMEKDLMEITRRLFPHTEGKHPAYDEEANRCLQQVKRWSDKVDELIRLVDSP